MLNDIPEELRLLQSWVLWRYITRDGKITKLPFQTNGVIANVTDQSTWASFPEVMEVLNRGGFDGIGFVLSKNDPYTIIDLDNKPDKPCSLEQLARHQKIYEAFHSYSELSVSKTGVHIVVRGLVPAGQHRDNVEIYSDSRYMVFTGDVLRNAPITDQQELLDILFTEMQPASKVTLEEIESKLSDHDIVNMAMRASNAEKFNALCAGDQTGYPSQSEADFALLSILAFYSPSNEQVRNIFRMSALGKRTKAIKNNTYLDFALGKIRANQLPQVDLSLLIANASKNFRFQKEETGFQNQPEEVPITEQDDPTYDPDQEELFKEIELPPGIIGELAVYFYKTAIRPVPEVALAAAIAIVAGVAGRTYNISGTGLNHYLILLAKTGSGKEGAMSGIENLIAAVRPRIPTVDQFIGPATFASGPALIRVLGDRPCFVSVLGEFGLTLQQLSDGRANSSQLMLRKVLLDLYNKSGWNRMLGSSVYSDSDKNTKIIQAPNVTILGESTPETFFSGLDNSHISEGLIPRFSIIEYNGDRPARNKNANIPPPPDLAQRFTDLVTVSLTTTNNNKCTQVELDIPGMQLLDAFDTKVDKIMNQSKTDVEIQLWNRAHLKALKLAALIAVGVNPYAPVIDSVAATWAIEFVATEIKQVAKRFYAGDVGTGDSKQLNDLKRTIQNYYEGPPPRTSGGKFRNLHAGKVIPYALLLQRTSGYASYRNDRLGATNALKRNVQALVDSGAIVEISKLHLVEKYQFSGVAYGISAHWS